MTLPRSVLLTVLFVPAGAGVAAAQGAPGMCQDCFAQPPPAAIAPELAPELAHKLGVGLHLTSLAIANDLDPDRPRELAGGGLQIRYRLSPRWELQLALDSVREHDEDGMPTGPELASGTLGALVHLRPLHRWDVYLLGAIGSIRERAESTRTGQAWETERSQVHLGIGLERRWNHLGIAAELRAVGIAPAEAGDMPTTTPRPGSVPTAEIEAEPDQAAMFTLAATYFF